MVSCNKVINLSGMCYESSITETTAMRYLKHVKAIQVKKAVSSFLDNSRNSGWDSLTK